MFDFRAPYEWDEINEKVKKQLSATGSVRVYQSVSSALLEVAMGIQLLYSHKKQFHYSIGTGTHAEEALLFLAKQGIRGVEIPAPVVEIDEKKSLFLLADKDDALTAQIFTPPTTTAKIFKITISHHEHFFKASSFDPGESDIFIYSATPQMAMAILGKRAQSLHSFFSAGLRWDALKDFNGFIKRREDASWVQKVEKEKWAGGEALLPAGMDRVYDRAILQWAGLDAGALRDILIRDHAVAPEHLETLSLSRWHETRLVTQFEKRGHSPQTLRGTLFMSCALGEDGGFKKKLEAAVNHLSKISSF